MRDITLEETVYFNFTTRAFASGVPTVLSGTPALSVLESNNATPITAGVSVSVDRASVVGLNQATVVATAANGYEAGKSYCVYISTGTVGGVSVVGEVVAQFTVQSGAAFTRLGAPAGASVSADIAAIEAQTDDIGAAGAGLTAVPWNAAWDAEVQSEVNDGLVAYNAASTTNITGGTITTTTNLTNLPAITANWLTAAGMAADASAEIADAVWDEAIAGHLAAGSTGLALNGATAPTAAAVADAVWDEALAGHLGAGSTGEALNAAGAAGDPWVTALPGAYGAGSAGKIIGDNINATISSRATASDMTSVLADTNELQTDWVNGGRLDLLIDAIKAKTDNLPADPADASDIAALVDALPTATENADALLNRDMSAVSDTNARSPLNALRFLRNKWDVAAGTLTVKKEDDTTTAWTGAVTSDAAAEPIIGSNPA